MTGKRASPEPKIAQVAGSGTGLIWRTMLPSSVELYDLSKDPAEEENLAAAHPGRVEAMKQRLDAASKEAAKPLFLADQFKVVLRNMNGEPVLPTDDGFGDPDRP